MRRTKREQQELEAQVNQVLKRCKAYIEVNGSGLPLRSILNRMKIHDSKHNALIDYIEKVGYLRNTGMGGWVTTKKFQEKFEYLRKRDQIFEFLRSIDELLGSFKNIITSGIFLSLLGINIVLIIYIYFIL